jgi:hypothetical protein
MIAKGLQMISGERFVRPRWIEVDLAAETEVPLSTVIAITIESRRQRTRLWLN